MKYVLTFLLVLIVSASASAQNNTVDLMGTGMNAQAADYLSRNGIIANNNTWMKQSDSTPTSRINVWRVDGSNNTEINAKSGKVINLSVAGTPIAAVSSTGISPLLSTFIDNQVPYVATMAATPVAGTNDIRSLTIIPTAAANTAAGLPAVPTAGDIYRFCNAGPNAVRVKAYGTPGINGAAAGTYLPLATFQCGMCVAQSATAWLCDLKTVPTPAGP